MDHSEIVRLYGPWAARTPADVAALFDGYAGRWWISGGWAIEAFTGVSRPHGDIDPSIPRSDVALLTEHLRGRLDVWAADRGTLRPLSDARTPVGASCSNLWLRASGADPWEYDVILMDADERSWRYKRDPRITLPFERILWEHGGLSYLRPEIQLLHKAPGLRVQDRADFAATLPRLGTDARLWLRSALEVAHPGHPWIALIQDAPSAPTADRVPPT